MESDFVKAFYDFLKTNKSIDKIYFFNKGANKIFIKNLNKIGYKVDTKKQTIKLSDNMNSVISKSILSIEGRNIQIYSFGIGSYSFGGNQMDTLVEKYKL